MTDNRKTFIAAAAILIGFGLFAYFLPRLMLLAADVSPWAAGAVAAIFMFGFFGVFWLRSRARR